MARVRSFFGMRDVDLDDGFDFLESPASSARGALLDLGADHSDSEDLEEQGRCAPAQLHFKEPKGPAAKVMSVYSLYRRQRSCFISRELVSLYAASALPALPACVAEYLRLCDIWVPHPGCSMRPRTCVSARLKGV